MNNHEIMQTIVKYVIKHPAVFSGGALADNGFYTRSLVKGSNEIVYGNPLDILADIIEKGEFFGEWVSASPEQATNPNNSRLFRINEGDILERTVAGEIVDLQDGVIVVKPKKVDSKDYLAPIKTPEGFRTSAQVLVDEQGIDQLVESFYRQ